MTRLQRCGHSQERRYVPSNCCREKTLDVHTRRWRRRGLITISIHCWGLMRYELFSVWAHLSLLKLKRENHKSIKICPSIQNLFINKWQEKSKTLACALRAAACWIWLLLSALLKGSLSSRVFLCTISRGFLNMASSSLTPAPQEKTWPYSHKHTHHRWLDTCLRRQPQRAYLPSG